MTMLTRNKDLALKCREQGCGKLVAFKFKWAARIPKNASSVKVSRGYESVWKRGEPFGGFGLRGSTSSLVLWDTSQYLTKLLMIQRTSLWMNPSASERCILQ